VALRYQHVMAGRDQAIAAALDALVQAAATLQPEGQVEGASGTLVARKPARDVLTSAQVGGGEPVDLDYLLSGRPDLNRRPPAPKAADNLRRADQGKAWSTLSETLQARV
jgi:hypothetical protein